MSPLRAKGTYDRVHILETPDDWPVALYEYEPRGASDGARTPVLACHGAFCRYNTYDLSGYGLAPYLAERGRHVFVLELRGRGRSLPPGAAARARAFRKGWTFADFQEKDLPAAISKVIERAGADRLDYVGHSMGGLLAFHFLAAVQDERVRKVVSVGSAAIVQVPRSENPEAAEAKRVDLVNLLAPLFGRLPGIPIGPASKFAALAYGLLPRDTLQMGFNPANMDPERFRQFLFNGSVSVSSRKFHFFRDHFWNADPETDRARTARYKHPTLFLSGAKDFLVPPPVVAHTYESIGSTEKAHESFSKASGYSADYGHGDLLLGRKVYEEVFPHIVRWLS